MIDGYNPRRQTGKIIAPGGSGGGTAGLSLDIVAAITTFPPSIITEGQDASFVVEVTNVGGTTRNFDGMLVVESGDKTKESLLAKKGVSLAPSEGETIRFDVPYDVWSDVQPGEYHMAFYVGDRDGNKTSIVSTPFRLDSKSSSSQNGDSTNRQEGSTNDETTPSKPMLSQRAMIGAIGALAFGTVYVISQDPLKKTRRRR